MVAFRSYWTGTVTVAEGDTVVVGVGPQWSGVNARPGDDILIDGHTVIISDVIDPTHLAIDPWPYDDVPPGTAYKITQRSPLRFFGVEAMADSSRIVAALDKSGFYHFVGPDEDEPDPSLGDDGQYARKPSTGEEWLKLGGLWVFQGVFGNLSATDTPWSGLTTYAANVIAPLGGKLWRSLQANNTNHRPDLSPSWWALFLSGGDAYDVVNFDTDRPADGELVLKMVFTKTVTFYAGLTDSKAAADTGATLSALYTFKKNGVSFGTATFAAAGSGGPQTATFASGADTTFAAGDVLTIFAPSTRDATLSGIGITLSGYRS
jgi:hypothetical protein